MESSQTPKNPQELSGENLKIVKRLQEDFPFYSAGALKVVDKEARTKPLVLNNAQRRIEKAIREQESAGLPVRVLIVKARQLGASTFVTGRFLWKAATQHNQSILEVAHDSEAASGLLSKVQYYYENLPQALKPVTKYRTKTELYFDDLNSSFKVATANNSSLGRSKTLNMVHLSEVAFYGKEGEKALLSVTQAVPNKPNTYIIGESTSNGFDSIWYDLVEAAMRGDNNYKVVFLGWFLDPDYDTGDNTPFELSHEEASIKKEHSLTYGQMAWRRYAIDNLCQGSIEKFRQEYPSNWKESFTYSGQPCFNIAELSNLRDKCIAPQFVGNVDTVNNTLVADKEGALKIWDYPVENHTYSIGIDVASGQEKASLDRDYSTIQVIDANTMSQVAVYKSRVSTDLLPYVVKQIALMYNKAYICPEINNHGLAVVQKLRDLRYNRIYKRRNLQDNNPSRTTLLGFMTTKSTKPVLIDGLAELVRMRDLNINDPETLDEMSKYSQDPKGRMGATSGHDDLVMAIALACYNLKYAPVMREVMLAHKKKEPLNFRYTLDEMVNQSSTEKEKWIKDHFAEELKRKGLI